MLGNFAGGIVIIAVAAIIGIAQNTVRSNPVKLIQDAKVVSTVNHGGEAEKTVGAETTPGTDAPTEVTLPEGAIDVDTARRLYDEGVTIFIDARSPSGYDEGHIPGAINIPYDQLPKYLETLQAETVTSDHIVCYCWSPTCDFSDQLATELNIMGYENVEVFTGGWEHWTAGGHPAEPEAEGVE